ncbi:hypothetical protein MKW92_005045 [Papaver armeniacum]|nr:hypothetical protein MKW92_005045 [Papaver armeniacum]
MCNLEKNGDIFILTLTGEDDQHRLIRTNAKPGSVLITTAQGKFFSNGLDLKFAAAAGSATGSDNRFGGIFGGFKFVIAELLSLPMPTIAAVSGHAAAAGFLLAELNIGLNFPDYCVDLLKSKIPSSRVRRDVLLRPMKIRADKAVEMGIVDFAYGTVEETKEAALKLAVKLGSNKWNGELC